MVKFSLRPLCCRERTVVNTELGAGRAEEPICNSGENNILHLQGFEAGIVTDGVVAVCRYTDYATQGAIIPLTG